MDVDLLIVISMLMQVLLRGPKNAREAVKHFGRAPGVPQNHIKPHVHTKGCKFEKARVTVMAEASRFEVVPAKGLRKFIKSHWWTQFWLRCRLAVVCLFVSLLFLEWKVLLL